MFIPFNGGHAMESFFIVAIFVVFGIFVYFASVNGLFRFGNGDRRSGKDRRRSYDADKNQMRRSGNPTHFTPKHNSHPNIVPT